nr:hypothetical protein [Tanacetum cinerariifolium]
VRAPRPQAVQIREALLAWLQSSMLESMPLYMAWAPLRSGMHRNSKRRLAHVVVIGWKQV